MRLSGETANPGTSAHVPVHDGCGGVFAGALDCPEQDKKHGKQTRSQVRARGSMDVPS